MTGRETLQDPDMPTGPVLIIASDEDHHIPFLTPHLDALGVEWVMFDPQHYPSSAQVSLRFGEGDEWALTLTDRRGALDLRSVRSVWYRGRSRPVAHSSASPDQAAWIAESCARFLSEMYECMDCLWLPERPMLDREPFRMRSPLDLTRRPAPTRLQAPSPYNKMHQLALAGRFGLSVPRTLVTNCPDEFLDFYEACDGRIIAKRSTNLEIHRDGGPASAPTHVVTRRDLAQYRSIRHEPVILQEQIAKRLELRITVVGDQVFAAAVHSQEHHRLQTDRGHHAEYGGERHHSVYPLPDAIARACVGITAALGLCFGAIDIIVTPDGRFVFLEVNPNGMWAFVEEYTGLPIAAAIARMLATGRASPTVAAPPILALDFA